MTDNISSGNVSNSENKASLSSPQAKSPLEEASEVNSSVPAQNPITPPVPKPVEPAVPTIADKNDEPQTTPAPNTDEFLKSILDGQPDTANNGPTSPPVETPLPPIEESAPPKPNPMLNGPTPPVSPVSQPSIEDESTLEKEVDKGDLLKSSQSDLGAETSAQPKIKDEVGGLDGIIANQEKKVSMSQPVAPDNGQKNEDQTVSSNFQLAAQKNKTVSGRSNKLLYVVVVIVIVAIGVYSAYTMFYAKSETTPAITSSSPVPLASAVSTQSPDQLRKNDLYVMQQALFSYYANSGSKYPVAPEIIFLNSPGNILENALVPNYLGSLPADPDVTKNYAYKSADGTKFELTAILDDATDTEAVLTGSKPILTVTQDSVAPGSTALTTSSSSNSVVQDTALTNADSSEIVSSPAF